MDLKNLESLSFFYPELILSGTILLLIVLDLLVRSQRTLATLVVIGCVASLLATFDLYSAQQGWLFHRMIILDNFSLFFKIFALVAVILTVWMSLGSNEIRRVHQGEYYTLLLTCTLGIFFMASASNLLDYAMLTTLYATGVRRTELIRLKTEDIDSQRMIVHIRQGKGNRDRDVPLTPKLLETLREYWRWMKPKTYLFPGMVDGWRADKPLTPKCVWTAVREAVADGPGRL